MVKGITLGVVTSMLTIGCGGRGDNVDVDLCLSVSCINYVSDQAEYLAQDGLNNIDAPNTFTVKNRLNIFIKGKFTAEECAGALINRII